MRASNAQPGGFIGASAAASRRLFAMKAKIFGLIVIGLVGGACAQACASFSADAGAEAPASDSGVGTTDSADLPSPAEAAAADSTDEGTRHDAGIVPPPDSTHCILWLRADLGVTMTGTSVTRWADQSERGDVTHDLLPFDPATPPTFASSDSVFGGHPVINFFGRDPAKTAALLHSKVWLNPESQPLTVYVVGLTSQLTPHPYIFDGIEAGARAAFWLNGDMGAFAGQAVAASASAPGNAPFVLSVVFNHGTSALYYNSNATSLTVTGSSALNFGDQGLTGVTVGGVFTGTPSMDGRLAEIIAYRGAHDFPMRTAVMKDYLAARYAADGGVQLVP